MHKHVSSQHFVTTCKITTTRVLCKITEYLFPALMQPSYALLPATIHPNTVGGICYAVIKAYINMLCQKQDSHQ